MGAGLFKNPVSYLGKARTLCCPGITISYGAGVLKLYMCKRKRAHHPIYDDKSINGTKRQSIIESNVQEKVWFTKLETIGGKKQRKTTNLKPPIESTQIGNVEATQET